MPSHCCPEIDSYPLLRPTTKQRAPREPPSRDELNDHERSVGHLGQALDLGQSRAGQHLAILRDRGPRASG